MKDHDNSNSASLMGCFAGPVLMWWLTGLVYRWVAPQVLESEHSYLYFLYPAFCGLFLGFASTELLKSQDDLPSRIRTVRNVLIQLALFSTFIMWENRDRAFEWFPGLSLILVLCAALWAVCLWRKRRL